MATWRVICEACGWESFRQKEDATGRACPECRQKALRQEPYKPVATSPGAP